jgi:hypothetical protein
MARKFVAASSQYLSYAGNIVTGVPVSAGFWATMPTTANTVQTVFATVNGADTHRLMYDSNNVVGPGATKLFRAHIQVGLTLVTLSASGASNPWNFIVSTHKGGFGTKHRMYLNGAEVSNSATAVAPTITSGSTNIGFLPGGTPQYYDGSVEWAFIVPVLLTAHEIGCMYRNGPPWLTRPDIYAAGAGACWPMIAGQSPEANFMGFGTYDMTLNNGPTRVLGAPVSVPGGVMVA